MQFTIGFDCKRCRKNSILKLNSERFTKDGHTELKCRRCGHISGQMRIDFKTVEMAEAAK